MTETFVFDGFCSTGQGRRQEQLESSWRWKISNLQRRIDRWIVCSRGRLVARRVEERRMEIERNQRQSGRSRAAARHAKKNGRSV